MDTASREIDLKLAFVGEKHGFKCLKYTIIPYEAVAYCTAEELQYEDKWGDPVSSSGVTVVMESGKVWLRGDDAVRFCEGYLNYIMEIEKTKDVNEKFYDLIKEQSEPPSGPRFKKRES